MAVQRDNRPRLGSEELTAIAPYGAKAHWPEGFSIYQRGTVADGMFVVVAGSVVLRTMKGKRRFIPSLVFAGETFGGEGLTPGITYATDAQAAEASETLHINSSRFRALLREQPNHALAVIAQAFAERAALLERIHDFCASSVDERMTSALLRLFEGRAENHDDRLVLRSADHRLLCELVGATRESVTHALSRLVAAGAASRDGSVVVVLRSRLLDERRATRGADRIIERPVMVEAQSG